MVRRDDAMVARKLREPGAVRLQPLAGMQEQQRTPLPLLLDLQLDAGDGDVPAHAVPPCSCRWIRVYAPVRRGQPRRVGIASMWPAWSFRAAGTRAGGRSCGLPARHRLRMKDHAE